MARTLTLKNLPDALHARLAAAARRHRRSLNQQAIVCLEAALQDAPLSVSGFGMLKSKRPPVPVDFDAASLEAGHEQSRGLESFSSQPNARAC